MTKPKNSKSGKRNGTDPSAPKIAYLIENGTDEEIRAAMNDTIDGFDDWPEREKVEAIRLTQNFWQRVMPEAVRVTDEKSIAPQGDASLAILRFSEIFASSSEHFCNDRIAQIANHMNATSTGSNDGNVSAALAFVTGGVAQDPVQSSLLTQMAATHDSAMRALKRMEGTEYVEQAKMFGNLASKLMNLYARQAETLAKLQRGAEQTVRHVYVDARTQTAYNYPPSLIETREQSHEQHDGSAFGPSMLGHDPQGDGMPVPGDTGAQPLPTTRREGGRSKGQ